MMGLLYGKKVLGVQLFVTCSLLLLAALSLAGAQVADVTPKLGHPPRAREGLFGNADLAQQPGAFKRPVADLVVTAGSAAVAGRIHFHLE